MTTATDSTTALFVLPQGDSKTLLEQRRKQRQLTREAAKLIGEPCSNEPKYFNGKRIKPDEDELYIELWRDIVSRDENTDAIAEAVEQFTPDEIALFIVALIERIPKRPVITEQAADDLFSMSADLRAVMNDLEATARRIQKAVNNAT